jgi:hypothetical protein
MLCNAGIEGPTNSIHRVRFQNSFPLMAGIFEMAEATNSKRSTRKPGTAGAISLWHIGFWGSPQSQEKLKDRNYFTLAPEIVGVHFL